MQVGAKRASGTVEYGTVRPQHSCSTAPWISQTLIGLSSEAHHGRHDSQNGTLPRLGWHRPRGATPREPGSARLSDNNIRICRRLSVVRGFELAPFSSMVTLSACAGLSSPVTSFRLAIRGAVVSGMVGIAQGGVLTICEPARRRALARRPDDVLSSGLEATIGGRGVDEGVEADLRSLWLWSLWAYSASRGRRWPRTRSRESRFAARSLHRGRPTW